MKIGFIGLGHMGSGMASSLLRAGHHVMVYNRTASKAGELTKKGAVAVSRIPDACDADAVVTDLVDGKQPPILSPVQCPVKSLAPEFALLLWGAVCRRASVKGIPD